MPKLIISSQENSYESPEEDNTVSSASLCMSPSSEDRTDAPARGAPVCAFTPYSRVNGHDARARNSDIVNGNVTVNIISESTNSMDVLSGGESDAGDTLSRRNNNNSISSGVHLGTLKESTTELPRVTNATGRRNCDITYYVAKELLMTERTYKRDLELVTVTWSNRISELVGESGAGGSMSAGAGVARGCLALEPLVLPAGAALHRLEKMLHHQNDVEQKEPEYNKIAELLYDYLSSVADAYVSYISNAATLVALSESSRRRSAGVSRAATDFESQAPLPLACLLLRPLHRAQHLYILAEELCKADHTAGCDAVRVWRAVRDAADTHLPHVENHAALCQLQRDIAGYDKLLVADREFIRLGCLYKHSTRGLQQRMLFLFSDLLVVTSKCGSGQFRAHAAYALHTLELRPDTHPHTFTLIGEEIELVFSASNDREYDGWCDALEDAVHRAHERACALDAHAHIDTELTHTDTEPESSSMNSCGGSLSHVCWHRGTSLDRERLQLAMRCQQSGYLLRKFKKSPGWQKLWVVFACATLYFYKSWQDAAALASLPLLGYSVGVPSAEDNIDKDYVFKLRFKNHVYFFRADGQYTYTRWTDVLKTAIGHSNKEDN